MVQCSSLNTPGVSSLCYHDKDEKKEVLKGRLQTVLLREGISNKKFNCLVAFCPIFVEDGIFGHLCLNGMKIFVLRTAKLEKKNTRKYQSGN